MTTTTTINPATEEEIASYHRISEKTTKDKITKANEAYKALGFEYEIVCED